MNDTPYRASPPTDDDAAQPLASIPQLAERPLVRVYTLGPLTLEWVGTPTPFPPERLQSRGAAPALVLLKALISRPHRCATNDWLREHLRSAEEEAMTSARLEDLASLLRGLLCPPMQDTARRDRLRLQLLTRVYGSSESGPGYRLGGYPLIWVDIDALKWSVEQACRLERFGEDALPFWERAYALARRGEYLEEEPYSDWAEPRRAEAARYLRQSVHALSRRYLRQPEARGEEEALRLLGDYWQQHVEDEDALRPLMELLGKHERYQEALSYYDRLCEVLEEEGRTPDARTTDLKEFLCAKQLQRSRVPQKHDHIGNGYAISALSQQDWSSLFTQAMKQGILQAASFVPSEVGIFLPVSVLSGQGMQAPIFGSQSFPLTGAQFGRWAIWFGLKLGQCLTLVDHWQGQALVCDRLQALLDQEIRMFDAVKPPGDDGAYLLSRRQILIAFASSMALGTGIPQGLTSTGIIEKVLPRCAACITVCWHLLKGSEFAIIEQTLSACLLTLTTLARQPSPYQQAAAKLASQAYRILGIVALHQNNLQARVHYCQQALTYTEIAGEPSSTAAALISLASTFYYAKNPIKAADTYTKALAYVEEIPPLQRSRLHAELAVVYAQQHQEQEALHALELAQELYPEHPESDPSFLYAEFSPSSLILEHGLALLSLAQGFPERKYEQRAWETFAQLEDLQTQTTVPERIRLEIINHQAEVALCARNLEAFCTCLEQGILGAEALGSKQRLQEATEVYDQALQVWSSESSVKKLARLFPPTSHKSHWT